MDEPDRPLTPAGRRILDAASALFYRDGIHPVGVALVAGTAGVTKKTLYDCFGSKDALVVHYLRNRHRRWWEHLERRLAETSGSGALTLFDAYLDHPELDTDRGCAFLNAAAELRADHPGLDVIREHKRVIHERLGELVAQAHPDAAPRDVDDVSETVYLMLEGAVAHLGLRDGTRVGAARRLAESHLDRLDA